MKVDRKAHERSTRRRLTSGVAAVSMLIGLLVTIPASPAQAAPTSDLSLNVISARTEPRAFGGAGVTKGDADRRTSSTSSTSTTPAPPTQRSPAPGSGCSATDPGYPDNCHWPSIAEPSGWSPIYAQGDQDDFAATSTRCRRPLPDLRPGRRLQDRRRALLRRHGRRRPGAHRRSTACSRSSCSPTRCPTGTLRALVFEDNAPTNMGPDAGEAEPGRLRRPHRRHPRRDPDRRLRQPALHQVRGRGLDTTRTRSTPTRSRSAASTPTCSRSRSPAPAASASATRTACWRSRTWAPTATRVSVTPPDGQTWIQTTTLEGNHDYDAWVMEGDTGYDTDLRAGRRARPAADLRLRPAAHERHRSAGGRGPHQGRRGRRQDLHPAEGWRLRLLGRQHRHQGRRPDRQAVALARATCRRGDAAVWVGQGDADGTLRHHRRARRQLHADLVGRAAGLQPQHRST